MSSANLATICFQPEVVLEEKIEGVLEESKEKLTQR